MAKYPGLYQREGVWYVRVRVPTDLRHIERREQVRLSLETTDRREALERYSQRRHEIVLAFKALRLSLEKQDHLSASLATGKIDRLSRQEIERLALDWWAKRERVRQPVARDEDDITEVLNAIDGEAAARMKDRLFDAEPNRWLADQLLVEAGAPSKPRSVGSLKTVTKYPEVDRSSDAYRYLLQLVARGIAVEEELARDSLLGQSSAAYDPVFNPSGAGANVQPTIPSDRNVRTLIAEYQAERNTRYGEESTRRRYGLLFRVMAEVWGEEAPVSAIGRPQCVEVLTFLKSLPPNASKKYPKLSLREAAQLRAIKDLASMSPNTVTGYMQSLTAVLRWAERGDWGVKVNTAGLVDDRANLVKRRGFTPDELQSLFVALAAFRTKQPSKFWVPALALYTGARAGEICQLRVEDVVTVGGVHCLNLTLFDADGRRVIDKRLKTATSERMVPLHPELIAAGFLKFVGARARSDLLFPDLAPKAGYSYTNTFSKWFGRFKKGLGFNEPSLVFHSFRHGFRDACREADIGDETALALGGWAGANQATRYGDRARVPNLDRAIRKIDFGGFQLSKLPV